MLALACMQPNLYAGTSRNIIKFLSHHVSVYKAICSG